MNFTLGTLIGLGGTQHRKQNVKEWSGEFGCWTVWLAAARVGRGCRLCLFIPSDSALPHPFLRPLHSRLGTRPTHLPMPCPPARAGCLVPAWGRAWRAGICAAGRVGPNPAAQLLGRV